LSAPQSLREQLLRDEAVVLHAYQDNRPEAYWTIGVGRLIDQRKGGGITHEEAMYLLDNDLARVRAQVAKSLPWSASLDEVRLDVLHAMAFQMGIKGLLGFNNTLRLTKAGQWVGAANQMLKSQWAKQTPTRAARLARQMETGVRQ
jgi:lysozyme